MAVNPRKKNERPLYRRGLSNSKQTQRYRPPIKAKHREEMRAFWGEIEVG